MNEAGSNSGQSSGTGRGRLAGILLAAGALIMLAFMAMHPAIHSHHPDEFFEEMKRKSLLSAVVNGSLIADMVLVLIGLLGLVDGLRWRSVLARAGLISYSLGMIGHTAAATINGFVISGLTALYARHGTEALASLTPLLALCREGNGAAARLGVFAMSAAIAIWSLALLRRPGATRAVGVLGLLCGIALPIAMALGHLPMDVHGFTLRIIVQSVWYLAVAVQLIRGRL